MDKLREECKAAWAKAQKGAWVDKPKPLAPKEKLIPNHLRTEANRSINLFIRMVNGFQPKNLPANDNPAPKGVFKSYENYTDWLEKKGFVRLGSGYFSAVYGKPGSNRVLKIAHSAHEDGWLDYILWASKKGFAGTFAPAVYSYKYHQTGTPKYAWQAKGFGVAVMERMASTVTYADKKSDAVAVHALYEPAVLGNPTAGLLIDLVYPGILKFSQALREDHRGVRLDLHGGNMMVRPDGSFVVTDPVGNRRSVNDNYKKRLKASDFTLAA